MLTYLGLIPGSTIHNKSHLSHTFLIGARRLIYISKIRGIIPRQSAFELLLFKTRKLEQKSALQLNELKKFHEKWRFKICRTKTSTIRENNSRTYMYANFSALSETSCCCFSLSYFFFHLLTVVQSVVMDS